MIDALGPLMFLGAFVLIFLGQPVAFALAGTALLFASLGVALGVLDYGLLYAFPERVFGTMSNYVLLAVPFFVFMGHVLRASRLAEEMLESIGALFGPMRGGLALATVLVGTLLAAATGVVGASVVAMGLISLPAMLNANYDERLALGTVASSATLGQIVPPSIVLVILGDQIGVSVSDLFRGAFIPGILLAGSYALYVGIAAWLKPSLAPALENRVVSAREVFSALKTLMPPLALIVVVLGGIFAGVATPTEAGALGAVGAIVLAVMRGRFGKSELLESGRETVKLTTMVMFLLLGSAMFSLVFRGLDGDLVFEHALANLPGGVVAFLVLTSLAVFFLGFFVDFFEIVFIVVPVVIPAAKALGIDLVWFSVLLAVNLQTSFLTPPFGFALFYMRGVMPMEIPTTTLYRAVMPFVIIQLAGLAAVAAFPELVLILVAD